MDVLPKWERIFYWIAGISTFAYTHWTFYKAGQEHKHYLRFHDGWSLLNRERDVVDSEWDCYLFFIYQITLLIAGHLVLSHVLVKLRLKEDVLKTCILVYDTLVLVYLFGTRLMLLFACEILLMFAVSSLGRVSLVWIVGMLMTSSLNMNWVEKLQMFESWHSSYYKEIFYVANAYLHLRLISAAIEFIRFKEPKPDRKDDWDGNTNQNFMKAKSLQDEAENKKDKTMPSTMLELSTKPSFLDFVSYNLYLPTLIYGPIVTFDDFYPQRKAFYASGQSLFSLQNVAFTVLRILFSFFVLEVTAHFMYPNSFSMNLYFVSKQSMPAMIGFIMWQSLYFTMKYVVMFGIGSVACKLDGIIPPPLPRCTATLYRYTDIWKYFDVGYYNIMKKYIYIPMGGSRCGFFQQSLASVMAFAFIYYWHGGTFDLFLWAAGNWSVIALEMVVIQLLRTQSGHFLTTRFSPAALLRLKALLYVPSFIMSSIQIACFFFSRDIAYYMADALILSASWSTILLEIAGFYLNFQNAIYITDYFLAKKEKQP